MKTSKQNLLLQGIKISLVCLAVASIFLIGLPQYYQNSAAAAAKRQKEKHVVPADSLESKNQMYFQNWNIYLGERHFASHKTSLFEGPILVRWVLCTDSVPFMYPLEKDETGGYIRKSNYDGVPTLCGWKEKGMFLSCPDQFGQRAYFKESWLTKDFWRTDQWKMALIANDISDGNYFLRDALKLNILNAPTAVELEFSNVKSIIENTLPFSVSLDTLDGSEMKKVLVLFTSIMKEKNTN